MAGHAIEVKEAHEPEKRSYRKLHHMEIELVKGPNAGHVVTHHHQSDGMTYHEPTKHVFSKEDAKDGTTAEHIMKHLGLSHPAMGEEPEQESQGEDGE